MIVDNVLNEKQKGYCDSEITLTECNDALNWTKKEKGPGSDGLTFEFNQCFGNNLKYILFKLL